jgi:hypothetical protein
LGITEKILMKRDVDVTRGEKEKSVETFSIIQ